jgi:hypothetical protein
MVSGLVSGMASGIASSLPSGIETPDVSVQLRKVRVRVLLVHGVHGGCCPTCFMLVLMTAKGIINTRNVQQASCFAPGGFLE